MDLYRFSAESVKKSLLDWTIDNRGKFFSIDGGKTKLADMAAGVLKTKTLNIGDGNEADHWFSGVRGTRVPNPPIGIMSSQVKPETVFKITEPDIVALDVIGWNRRQGAKAEK
ncbi:MAG: hypothetical protein KatS3mg105_0617 [Gemmatales bacterium]|nr:MAG: hypothetical protein KatS3mg105_0617 [Gemmatales bacterium]